MYLKNMLKPENYPKLWLILTCLLFAFPYIYLFSYVGKFPAESLTAGSYKALYRPLLCLPTHAELNQFTPPNLAQIAAAPAGEFGVAALGLPRINSTLHPLYATVLSNLSGSVYYSSENKAFFAHDKIDKITEQILWMTYQQGDLKRGELETFIAESKKKYPVCEIPNIYRGLTEGYWAAKGSATLHHWVHVYEALIPGKNKLAQYGYLIPNIAKKISDLTERPGPTAFARVAWILFGVIGMAYIMLLYRLFPENPFAVTIALQLKIFMFLSLGQFYMLLAPGYHWFRDIIIILIPYLTIKILKIYNNKNSYSSKELALFGALFCVTLLACFLTDPLYAFLSIISSCFTLIICSFNKAIQLAKILRNYLFFGVLLFFLGIAYIILRMDGGKFSFIMDKLNYGDFGLLSFNLEHYSIVFSVIVVSILVILFSINNGLRYRLCYFAISSIVLSLYFFILPDDAHFKKFMEIVIIFALSAIVYLELLVMRFYRRSSLIRENYFSVKEKIKNIKKLFLEKYLKIDYFATLSRLSSYQYKTILLIFPLFIGYYFVALRDDPAQDRRYRDQWTRGFYFSAEHHVINARHIEADLKPEIISHLKSFPKDVPADYIISNYDKYLSFLYDKRNGFEIPDLVAWISSEKKLEKSKKLINSEGETKVFILDLLALNPEVQMALLTRHKNFGYLSRASSLNVKGRMRLTELSISLIKSCKISFEDRQNGWAVLACEPRSSQREVDPL